MTDDFRDLTLKDFAGTGARDFIIEKLKNSDVQISDDEDIYDSFGGNIKEAANFFAVLLFMYKFYFRVDAHGVENLPADGPGLMVSNHAPILPLDAMMIGSACLVEPEKPRLVRSIINKSIANIPFFSTTMNRVGQIIGCDENVRRIFSNGNLMLVFPTGAEGQVHSIFNKYHMDRFTVGFMEYALKYKTPIIPTCVTGSEEAAMTLAGIDLPLAGFKHLPITPIFPWLGPLGLVPFPSKFDIYFGEPVDYFTENAERADDPAVVRELVDDLHGKIKKMLDDALGR